MKPIFSKNKCKSCYNKEYKNRNKDKIKDYDKQYRKVNSEKIKEIRKRGYENNKELHLERCRDYYLNNLEKCKLARKLYNSCHKEKISELNAIWREQNKAIIKEKRKIYKRLNKNLVNANNAKRRAQKLKAIPKWANLKIIKEFYKHCPEGYHVDHIVPLQGKNVCGLHVIENLQYLPAKENLRKGNRYG
jgi:hypothetical protein